MQDLRQPRLIQPPPPADVSPILTLLQKVKESLTILTLLVLIGVLAYGFVFLRKLNQTVESVNTTLQQTNKFVAATQVDLDNLSYHANAILIETSLTAMQLRKASITETAEVTALSNQVNDLVQEANVTAGNVNTTVIALKDNINTVGTSTNQAIQDIRPVLAESKVTLVDVDKSVQDVDKTVNSANVLIANPDIPKTIANVNETTANLNSATHRIDHEIDVLTKPKNLFVRICDGLLSTAAKVAVIVK